MPVKIKRSQKRLIALTLTERVKPQYFRLVKKFIKDEVISSIESGRSPVEKGGKNPQGTSGRLRYEQYSDSYKTAISKGRVKNKKQRPVNLKLTGKLLNSIKVKVYSDAVRVWFSDKKAKFHDEMGAGKSKVLRRLLPRGDNKEQFNAGIRKRMLNAMLAAIKLAKKGK